MNIRFVDIVIILLLLSGFKVTANADEIKCLAENIYHEARGESITGQVAVAAVTLNRVADKRWPNTVCEVVHQRWQFSWTEAKVFVFPHGRAYPQAVLIAKMALGGLIVDPTFNATHYHATWLKPPPQWAPKFEVTAIIGQHIFYR